MYIKDTVFRLNSIKAMTPLQAYNHTATTLLRYSNQLGVQEVNMNNTKWNIWGAIYFSMTVYTTIVIYNIYLEKINLINLHFAF